MRADLFLTNGPIYSGVHPKPYDYLAITGTRVLAIGRGSGKKFVGRKTEVVDLKGTSVTPAITDSHLHLLDYAWSLERVNLEPCRTQTEIENALSGIESSAEWVLGRGWTREQFNGFPHRNILDAIFPDRPVALNSRDGHFLWVNTEALKQANVQTDAAVSGGYVGKDPTGEPDGILGENAVGLVASKISRPKRESRKQSLLRAQSKLHVLGIAALHSTDGNEAFGDLQDLHAESALKLRVFHSIPLSQLENAVQLRMKSGLGDDWLRFGFVKIFSDGTLGSLSAAMLQPFNGTDTTGLDTISEPDLTIRIQTALRNGIAVAVHAIGDRANRQTLNAFEKNKEYLNLPAAQSRIEHAQLLHPDDIPRFAQIGIVASMQPHHAISDHDLAQTYWGDRVKYAYAWRMLQTNGTRLIFGSDAPIEDPDPLKGLRAAVHRWNWSDRSQTISALNSLAAYTIEPVRASGQSRDRGSLEPGKLADFILFSEDAVRDGFQNCKVVATAINGQFVYRI